MAGLITGIVSHVDAGKTTLSEALLYLCGVIRKQGRVDSGDSFLDTGSIERRHGITVFAKEAVLSDDITLIDTPGHVDFCFETERTLSVLDAAILLINAADGIQPHTKTLWSLLEEHDIPTLIFVNKMDMPDTDKGSILAALKKTFSEGIVDFSDTSSPGFREEVCASDEELTEKFLSDEPLAIQDIRSVVSERKVFPVLFGSALRLTGVDKLFETLKTFFVPRPVSPEFGCVVYKISCDRQGNRLSHIKVTGGSLKARDYIGEEKANELRIYSGDKFESVKEVPAGGLCVVTGLKNSFAGARYGSCSVNVGKRFEPAISYSVIPPEGTSASQMLEILRKIEDEMPEIRVEYGAATQEIRVMLMGELQTEILKELVRERFSVDISFGEGKIAYRETIRGNVVGIGHYEPLKHYAEVHLLLSPVERNSGLHFVSDISVDKLETNWQRLILTHLKEKIHTGVLTGSPVTDMEIRLLAGKAHLKHTEGGDFRQATYRAVRQGLMKAESILLEPVYSYEIVVPQENTGRVMSDLERMSGSCSLTENRGGFATLAGRCPVSEMRNYVSEIRSFSKGLGTLTAVVDGYEVCHNAEDVIREIAYNPDSDTENPASSVFCSHGAGFAVP